MANDKTSFEDVLEKVGVPGRYQRIQIVSVLSVKFATSFMILSFVFLGYEPPHVCNSVNETSFLMDHGFSNDSRIVYDSCHIKIFANESNAFREVGKIACPNGRHFYDAQGTTFVSEWDLACESRGIAELSQTVFSVGCMVSGVITSAIADRFGRRPLYLVSCAVAFVTEGILAFSPSITMVTVVRFISGVGFQGIVSSYFIMGLELLVPRQREAYGVGYCVYWIVCVLMLGGLAYGFENYSWRYLQGTMAALGLMCVVFLYFVNESPRWLAANNRKERTLKILKKASKQNGTSFEDVKMQVQAYWECNNQVPEKRDVYDESEEPVNSKFNIKDKRGKITFLTLVRNKQLRRITLLTSFIWITHHLAYFGLFMTSSNITGNRFLNYTLMALVEVPSNITILIMLQKMKRKTVLISFLALTALSLMTSSLFLTFSENNSTSDVLITIFFVLGKFAVGSSFNVIYIMAPEMYPTNFRSFGNGVIRTAGRIGYILAMFTRPLFAIAKWAPGLIFTVMCLISLIMATGLPETKDINLPNDVADLQETKKEKPKDELDGNTCLNVETTTT